MLGRLGWHAQTATLLAVATLMVGAIAAHMDVYSRLDPLSFVREPGWETQQIMAEIGAIAFAGLAPATIAYCIASLRPNSTVCQAIAALGSNVVCTAAAYPFLSWVAPEAPFFLGGLGVVFFGLALLGRFPVKARRVERRPASGAALDSPA